MRYILSSILILSIFFLVSCNKTSYGTSILIDNQLEETINVTLYPKDASFNFMKQFEVSSNENSGIYWTSQKDVDILNLFSTVFDSIVIQNQQMKIKFSPDGAINYSSNPYTDHSVWKSEVLKGKECSSRCKNTETENYYFQIVYENMGD